ncbi:glutamine-rich protein 2-like [Platysternon megacephalum]|uniref:Glutamine-rich protein 2-like n=1 Tax=Platysternon megacephalum TaxID=55544 RepID=A0A4D9EKG1_9SAUR|nr:glutamine-rich protein 2-like [Platysternon megacephalum]
MVPLLGCGRRGHLDADWGKKEVVGAGGLERVTGICPEVWWVGRTRGWGGGSGDCSVGAAGRAMPCSVPRHKWMLRDLVSHLPVGLHGGAQGPQIMAPWPV